MPSTYTTRIKRKKLLDVLDYNKDGSIGAEDIIVLSLKTPGIRINRDDYLAKELSTVCSQETIDLAISTTPLDAGISKEEIERLADEVVKYERNCVSGISSFLGLPGGYVAIATVPADIIQYYGFLLRAAQKLMYLYGFPQIVPNNGDSGIDTATINAIILCMGVMYGVKSASRALLVISKAFANGVEKKLLKAALTKGTIYPIVKETAKWFGKKMTKNVFAGFFKKAIPVVGAGIGFATTFFTFKPCCENLRKSLRKTYLFDKENKDNNDELIIEAKIID